ncbi:ribosome hibernation-promoting factor, HPF/YfiA family [Nitrospira sp. BLG_2]|uniref:ribosome hibernation-promoting factor, HPF/YfiA family n=1 Tax=Nitrospira sp. BLG_2 TaxID=3397507 RepID=UPI003B9A6B32
MQILVTGRHMEVTDEVREFVLAKAGKLSKYYDRIHEIEVILDHESEEFTTEMIVRADHKHTFVASGSGPEIIPLIDAITEKLERQLKKLKEKRRNHKGGLAADGVGTEG